jgi:transposase
MIPELIQRHWGVTYHAHDLWTLVDHLGFSFQKARFVSDHLNAAARLRWLTQNWPTIVRMARQLKVMILFGDEASFAQWGSLSDPCAPKGQPLLVKTRGKRQAYQVFGLIDYCSGRFFYNAHTRRFNSESDATFRRAVLSQTTQPLIVIQDGATYHTSKAMVQFFADHEDRLIQVPLPSSLPDFNPIEELWQKVKRESTHRKYFPEFAALMAQVDHVLGHFATTTQESMALMGRYGELLGEVAA